MELTQKNLMRELSPLSVEARCAVAVRAGMRVLPVLSAHRVKGSPVFEYWENDDRASHILAVIRTYQGAISYILSGRSLSKNARAAVAAAHDEGGRSAALTTIAKRSADSAIAVVLATGHIAELTVATDTASRATSATAAVEAAAAALTDDQQSNRAAITALKTDLVFVSRELGALRPTRLASVPLLAQPLWPEQIPARIAKLWQSFEIDVLNLKAGFDVWVDWYRDRLGGKPFDFDVEEKWAAISDERLAQGPAEINAYLKSLRGGIAEKQLNRVRAIFIGHGGVGKTSIINALHGDDVVEGVEPMTRGIAIQDSSKKGPGRQIEKIHEDAGVFTRTKSFSDHDLTVHFWDFGGQVMAHATHQFFLRARCLYVIVLDARKERNANEEAEYWLEHVRAFGDNAPVLLVGNKTDQVPVNLDLGSLKEKYGNVKDFYPVSCTEARGRFRAEFDRFSRDFNEALINIGVHGERFTAPQFRVLKQVQTAAARDDFLSHELFHKICAKCGIATTGPEGRDQLLDLFDKLGIVMHFPRLPFLTDFVLNPRWLTYGVYTIMYSGNAQSAKGRLSEVDVVSILKGATLSNAGDMRTLRYPPERCRLIVEAMVAFGVAYRLAHDPQRLVIPALLEPQQPAHDFKADGAIAFQLDFKGFLPRHVLPSLIVDHHMDIARSHPDREIVWQNGVLLRPGRGIDAEALVKADYHERNLDVLVAGSDANTYLGQLRDSILRTLQLMPELRYDENVRLRAEMRIGGGELRQPSERPVWMDYKTIRVAQKNKIMALAGPDGIYDLDKILAVMPVSPALRPADIFISYSSKDRPAVDKLAAEIEKAGYSVWFDRELLGGQQYRDVIDQRIDASRAVVVLWTTNSIGSRYVRHEASRAADEKKLICLRDVNLNARMIPGPFPANDHMLELGDSSGLMKAFALLGIGRG